MKLQFQQPTTSLELQMCMFVDIRVLFKGLKLIIFVLMKFCQIKEVIKYELNFNPFSCIHEFTPFLHSFCLMLKVLLTRA